VADIAGFLSAAGLHEELAPVYEGRGGGASEHAAVKQWALSDPDGFQPLIDLLTAAVTQFLERQIEAGAEAVQLFESWAGILPDAFFERWCVRPAAAIVAALKATHPDVPVIAFPRGAGLGYDGFAEATGADCLGLDATVPPSGPRGRCSAAWAAACRATSIPSSWWPAAPHWRPRQTASCAP
jgi:uroporphyrinogen decarboxylase